MRVIEGERVQMSQQASRASVAAAEDEQHTERPQCHFSNWHVYKFGGSSLGTFGRMPKVLDCIAQGPRPLVVVVSALGDTTEWLSAAAQAAAAGDLPSARHGLARARELALTVASTVLSPGQRAPFETVLAALVEPLERVLIGVELLRECTPHTLDMVMSAGERISAELVSRALLARGIAAQAVDARGFLITDDRAGAANVDHTRTSERLVSLEPSWRTTLPVVTGFIGQTPTGRTTTLGRNGSDYTATTVGQILRAAQVTVWTDVPGVMTADPGLVSDAYPVARLTYGEALELAQFGTKMFHPRTILPLLETGASLRIRSTLNPELPGTHIDRVGNQDARRPTCVTSLENLALLSVEHNHSSAYHQIGGRVLSALHQAQIRIWMSTQSSLGQSISVVVSQAEAERAHALLRDTFSAELARQELSLAPRVGPVSLLTLVAESMASVPNVAGRLFHALGNIGVNVKAIAKGSRARSISCVVGAEETAVAVRTVHTAFNLARTELSVLLLGKGTVGGRLLEQLARHGDTLRDREGVDLKLVGLVGARRSLLRKDGLPPHEAVRRLESEGQLKGRTEDVEALLRELAKLPSPVLVDCTAAAGMEELYEKAFALGVHVVAANKLPLALPQARRNQLLAAAREHFRNYHYETTVGASLPVIETLKNLVRTGDRVESIEGSFSGTLGFLSHRLMKGDSLSDAVRSAREKGFTEPHPREDLSGQDVARKAVILAREMGLEVELEEVQLEPFVPQAALQEDDPEAFLTGLKAYDAQFAEQVARYRAEGKSLRYLARIDPHGAGPKVRVSPVAVDVDHPSSGLKGAEAFVAFTTERYREYPLIVRGAGAGADVTAAGVLADILRLTQNVHGRR